MYDRVMISKCRLICCFLCSLFLINGCSAVPLQVAANLDSTADSDSSIVSKSVTPEITDLAFQTQLDMLESTLSDESIVTLTVIKEITPQLANMIQTDYISVFFLCSADLLSPDNNEPLRDCLNEKLNQTPPTKRQKIECELFRCLIDEYEPSSVESLANNEGFSWLAWFYTLDITHMCIDYGVDPTSPFYIEHPLRQQFLIAMLREPVWRMPTLTPLASELYDQDSYVDAFNSYCDFLESGEQSSQLVIEPDVDNPRTLCTEATVLTMTQAEDFTVTLEVALENGDIVTLTYTPQHEQLEFVEK